MGGIHGLGPRAEVTGGDEIAQLAQAFNVMAGQLEDTARKQQELEDLRRDLIAWTGHDLQTPLASVRAIVEALADGVVVRSGAWFSYGDLRLGQGRENAKVFLRDNPDLIGEIREAVLARRAAAAAAKEASSAKGGASRASAAGAPGQSAPGRKRKRA